MSFSFLDFRAAELAASVGSTDRINLFWLGHMKKVYRSERHVSVSYTSRVFVNAHPIICIRWVATEALTLGARFRYGTTCD